MQIRDMAKRIHCFPSQAFANLRCGRNPRFKAYPKIKFKARENPRVKASHAFPRAFFGILGYALSYTSALCRTRVIAQGA
jgi:hypothetical protein